jgi:hypothetical protein
MCWEFNKDTDQYYLKWQSGSNSLLLDNLVCNDLRCDKVIASLLLDEDAATDQVRILQKALEKDKNYIFRPHVFPPKDASFFSNIDSQEYNLEHSIVVIMILF